MVRLFLGKLRAQVWCGKGVWVKGRAPSLYCLRRTANWWQEEDIKQRKLSASTKDS